MPMPNFTSALNAQLLNAINRTDLTKRIKQNAKFVKQIFSWWDMCLSLIAQVMMFSWLQCLLVLRLWTQHSYSLQEINHAHNHILVSIWLLWRSWTWIKSLLSKIRLTSLLKTLMDASSNRKILRNSSMELSLKVLLSCQFLPRWVTTLKQS